MRLSFICDEKLTLIRSWSFVGHTEHSPLVVTVGRMKLVVEITAVTAPNGLSAFSSVGGVSSLNHEGTHVAMKDGLIVIARGAEGEEIEGSPGSCVAEYFEL